MVKKCGLIKVKKWNSRKVKKCALNKTEKGGSSEAEKYISVWLRKCMLFEKGK